jgi:hypothetical protein
LNHHYPSCQSFPELFSQLLQVAVLVDSSAVVQVGVLAVVPVYVFVSDS